MFMRFQAALFFIWALATVPAGAQTATAEDSLQAASTFVGSTVLSGYGNIRYQRDANAQTSTIDLERFVIFVGHRFDRTISLFSELEVEDAKVEGGGPGGEIALEQAYVQFDLDAHNAIVAGLFLPRIGILNENHLPPDFNGNERTIVETLVIPATWRELGAGLYGSLDAGQIRYSLALLNGLNSSAFEHGSLIREGRFEGRNASANSLALNGSVQVSRGDLMLQVSGYLGGTVGLSSQQADSLGLASGPFGTPVLMGETDLRYRAHGFSFQALGTVVSIPDAGSINRAYGNNTPQTAYGAYAEIAYDLLASAPALSPKQLIIFSRLEKLDLNARIPANGTPDPTLNQRHLVVGLTYLPISSIALKADVRFAHLGSPNASSVVVPGTVGAAGAANTTYINLGIGFAF